MPGRESRSAGHAGPHLLSLPPDYDLVVGADTGAYMAAVFVAISPDPYSAFIVAEFPNYRYVGGEIELLGLSIPEWSRQVTDVWHALRPDKKLHAWADRNTQFQSELQHYDIFLQRNMRRDELRVEIAREYFQQDKIRLAPWLSILPYELENAQWPDEVTSAGKFMRIRRDDHTLSALEHALSRRPRTKRLMEKQKTSFVENFLAKHRNPVVTRTDPHLGRL